MKKIINCRFDNDAWTEVTLSVKFSVLELKNATNE